MEKNDNDNEESNAKREKLPFGSKENMITVLNDLFKYGHQNLPFSSVLGMSTDECRSNIDSAFKLTQTFLKDKPSVVGWLHSNLFKESEYNIPMALLFIALYEQQSLPQKKIECDFSEVYHFLYKMMTNQPAPQLSSNSATVLHRLLSELIEEVWPNKQLDLLRYLSQIHIYSRTPVRRTYSRKKLV
ncbi:hypothetical protein ALC62_03987 [Cyphomyrmex costatus]|uniref:Uncharacterized protein n=1 Tax=Cyphomyrmex costatus TaxID=456900 RepID=A0A195CX02_9HYME|nr:hypothetical protein ALC62_03987 [Cyphomyrmex costatus]